MGFVPVGAWVKTDILCDKDRGEEMCIRGVDGEKGGRAVAGGRMGRENGYRYIKDKGRWQGKEGGLLPDMP